MDQRSVRTDGSRSALSEAAYTGTELSVIAKAMNGDPSVDIVSVGTDFSVHILDSVVT